MKVRYTLGPTYGWSHRDRHLYDAEGNQAFPKETFNSAEEAQSWLDSNELHGRVQASESKAAYTKLSTT